MDEKLDINLTRIEGTVERILFSNPQNGYIVIDLDMGDSYTTVVGDLGNVEAGEELCVTGKFVTHSRFGLQFQASQCDRKLPETAHAIEKYLSTGIIKGIGPSLAKKIVAKFGEQTLNIMENDPEQLTQVRGITQKKYEEISQEFRRIFGIRKLMIYLSNYSISPAAAVRVWKKWGQFSLDIVKENPYALCSDSIEVDFHKADKIGVSMNVVADNTNRVRAAISYVLADNALSGHTCLPTERLMKITCDMLCISEQAFYETLEQEYNEENLVEYMKHNRAFTLTKDFYTAESYIAGRMSVMNAFFKDSYLDYDALIDIEEERSGIRYQALQRKAISLALSQGFFILTGGPGTGKTTTLNAIISLYEQQGMRVMISAPTGRAAKRISDLTGYDAKTIHRLLEVGFDNNGRLRFVHNENNPLPCDVLIVDEMSMVDTLLFEAFLRAMKLSCRLIMVGDSDQLPSVGAGNLLKNMIDSKMITVVQLKEIFRQAQKSCIVTNAHKIVEGIMPDLTQKNSDFFFIQRLKEPAAIETIIDLYKNRLPKAYELSARDDIQILCPSRKGTTGVVELNKRLQNEINPPQKGLNEANGMIYTFREQDKVMQTKNNYDIVWSKEDEAGAGIYNGDIGTILFINKAEGIVQINFDGRIAEYGLEMLEQLELAYAITVHKSQGSEFPVVILPLLGGFEKLYYRNLLYTAVTRAKKLLVIVGSQNRVEYMVSNDRRTLRYTCLKEMLIEEMRNDTIEQMEQIE